MNSLDIAILAVGLIFALRGLLRGLVKEVCSLAAVALGLYLAGSHHELAAPYVGHLVSGPANVRVASYLAIFLGTLVAAWALVKVVGMFLKLAMLAWVDYLFGALFGLAEGFVVAAALVMLLHSFMPDAGFLAQSRAAPLVSEATAFCLDHAPESVPRLLRESGLKLPRHS